MFRLCEQLGSGAFATVYRGVWHHFNIETDQSIDDVVAVKSVDCEVSEEDRVRFLQEATIMAQFKHCNIVAIRGIITKNQVRWNLSD